MNRFTFSDAIHNKRASLANDIERYHDDDDVETRGRAHNQPIQGEENDNTDMFNDAGKQFPSFFLYLFT